MNRLIAVSTLAILTGCAPTPQMTLDDRVAINEMDIYRGEPVEGQYFNVLGKVKGLSCLRNKYVDSATYAEAFFNLKHKAVQLDADSVFNLQCVETGTDWRNNCWATVACEGDAVDINMQTEIKEKAASPGEFLI